MQQDKYTQIKIDADYTVFEFVSEGRYGRLTKIVSFDEFKGDMFNLALGTVLPNGDIDYLSITDNGDGNKVLTTVAGIVGTYY